LRVEARSAGLEYRPWAVEALCAVIGAKRTIPVGPKTARMVILDVFLKSRDGRLCYRFGKLFLANNERLRERETL
jgi:hypothetical protein